MERKLRGRAGHASQLAIKRCVPNTTAVTSTALSQGLAYGYQADTMVHQMIVLALCVASALGGAIPAAKYPAGVNPHACPNYPYCDNVALAAHSAGHHGAVAPYAAHAYGAYGHHGVGVHGAAGPKVYPAGVDPHVCPNYPYCGPTPVHAAGHHGAGAWAGHNAGAWAGHNAGAWAGAAHHGGAWAGAHNQWDDGSYHGDDGSYHGGEDDGSYKPWNDGSHDGHWDDGSYNHWDDGSHHHGGHHW